LKTETKGKDNSYLALMEASYRVARTAGKWKLNKARTIRSKTLKLNEQLQNKG
jgi:hypothetical protein